MNFFGHAALAAGEDTRSGFILGAMVPDFATMIRAREPGANHEELSAGMAHHHRIDAAFHAAPTFVRLCRDASNALEARGVRRGSARAVAHVGIELLLDGALARDPRARDGYLSALAVSADTQLGRHLLWRDDGERARFISLTSILGARGLATTDADPARIVYRLTRALSGRPRLELRTSDEALVLAWATENRPLVEHAAPALLAEVHGSVKAL